MSVRCAVDHEWTDASKDDYRRPLSIKASRPNGERIRVDVDISFFYDKSMTPMRCVRCGMKQLNGQPESPDDCDTHVVRMVIES